MLEVIESYGDLLSSEAQLSSAEERLKRAELDFAEAKEQVQAGIRSETSLLEAELGVLNARIELEESAAGYAGEKEEFGRVILGIDEDYELASFEIDLDALSASAGELVADETAVQAGVLLTQEAKSARERVEDAREALKVVRLDALPQLSTEAGVYSGGWKVGWGISFDLFDPDRFLNIDIAAANLSLAEVKEQAALESARNIILSKQAALQRSLEDIERLSLEEQKWVLEERVMNTKREDGTIAEEDWQDFARSKEAFELEAEEREIALLTNHLSYRDALGLELKWEEWL